jgi:[ribosomal protein S5]-alanine N-acetyltransferase
MMNTKFKYSLEGQETERLLFRPIVESDFDTWLVFCSYPDSVKYIYTQEELAIEDPIERCKIWFGRVFNRYAKGLGGMNALIDKRTNEFVGQCGLLIQTIDDLEELEIGYSLMPAHRGKGYATEAAKKCKQFAFEHNLRDSLISTIHIDNDASARVAIANGMKLDKTTVSKGDPVNIYRIYKSEYESI